MKLSDRGLIEIAEIEGIVPAPYQNDGDVPTWGIGHTASAGDPDPAKMNKAMPVGKMLEAKIDEALQVFRLDADKFEARINNAIKVPVKQHQFDALVSWDFNTGGATWRNASGGAAQIIQQINAGDMSGTGLLGWLKPETLKKRREGELALFRTGDYDGNGTLVPIWKTNGKGRRGGLLRTMEGAELLRRMKRLLPNGRQPWRLCRILGGLTK